MALTAESFGVDLYCVTDLTPEMRETSGIVLLQQALARRLDTPRGFLVDDQTYGLDVAGRLSDSVTAAELFRLVSDVRGELEKDERVLTVDVRVVASGALSQTRLALAVDGATADGPFSLTLAIGDVTVDLIEDLH